MYYFVTRNKKNHNSSNADRHHLILKNCPFITKENIVLFNPIDKKTIPGEVFKCNKWW